MWGNIAIAFLLAFITAFILTPYSIRLAKKVGAVDIPKDSRRMHKKPMPKLRRSCCYSRFFSICYLSFNNNDNRKKYRFIWNRRIFI